MWTLSFFLSRVFFFTRPSVYKKPYEYVLRNFKKPFFTTALSDNDAIVKWFDGLDCTCRRMGDFWHV